MNESRASLSMGKGHERSLVVIVPLAVTALLAAWLGGTGIAILLVLTLGAYVLFAPSSHAGAGVGELRTRVQWLEDQVRELERAVRDLRAADAAPGERKRAPQPPPPVARIPEVEPVARRAPEPKPPAAEWAFDWGRRISAADLMGAKALAFAGAVVTLLGVLFFFVLAVNRGWIGPGIRVGCGGAASALVFACGFWLRRRYGASYSALAAFGVGIAGAYATLLAAASLYDLLSRPVALVIAAAIAAIGVAVSLAWESEIVAGFGLIGAMLVPATLVFQGGLQQVGTAFVAIVFTGTAVVAVRRQWWNLLRAAAIVSVPQALAQVAQAGAPHGGIVVLAATFWLAYLGAGLAYQLRLGRELAAAPASFLGGSAAFAGICAALLYGQRDDGLDQGIALLAVAGVYLAAAAVLFRLAREAATLLWALGLTAAAVGVGQALSGSPVTYAWAAEGALLAWLSARLRDVRFQLGSLAYLVLAAAHAIVFEARPGLLFDAARHPAKGAPAAVAVVAAALVLAALARTCEDERSAGGILAVLEPAFAQLRRRQATVRAAVLAAAAALAAYAASLGILELFQDAAVGAGLDDRFEWGHVAVTATWSVAALAAVLVASWRRSDSTLALGFLSLGVTVAKVLAFDLLVLGENRYGIAFVVAGTAVLFAGIARQVAARDGLTPAGAAAVVLSLPLVLTGTLTLLVPMVWGVDGDGLGLLVVGAAYTGLGGAALARRERDLATLLWALGLFVVAAGEAWLLSGSWLVLAWTVSAAALAGVAFWLGEARLQFASLPYLVIGAAVALIDEAPPSHLLLASEHPGRGLPSLLLVVGATIAFAWSLGARPQFRVAAIWTAGALAVYAASLAILEVMQRISPEGVHTDFQRGQTAVSAFWGVLALISLYLGLTRARRLLRIGGFVLFAVSLGKIFVYDLPSLSSAQRALSFLAVGAVLLSGGFFYQRLSAQLDDRL
jgi:uncharacterized membrane protein